MVPSYGLAFILDVDGPSQWSKNLCILRFLSMYWRCGALPSASICRSGSSPSLLGFLSISCLCGGAWGISAPSGCSSCACSSGCCSSSVPLVSESSNPYRFGCLTIRRSPRLRLPCPRPRGRPLPLRGSSPCCSGGCCS